MVIFNAENYNLPIKWIRWILAWLIDFYSDFQVLFYKLKKGLERFIRIKWFNFTPVIWVSKLWKGLVLICIYYYE